MSFKWRPPTDQERITALEEQVDRFYNLESKIEEIGKHIKDVEDNAKEAKSEHQQSKFAYGLLITVILTVGAILVTSLFFIRSELSEKNIHLQQQVNNIEEKIENLEKNSEN